VNTSWDVEMYDVDLFDASQAAIDALHASGRAVVARFRAGVWEDWRPDAGDYPAALLGSAVDGWPGERWVDIGNLDLLRPLIEARLDLAVAKGFDGVEPSDVDGHLAATGFSLGPAEQLAFNRWLAIAAHARGLSVGLRDDRVQVADLVDWFDWALGERIYEFNEASSMQPFHDAGKAVFGVEFTGDPSLICPMAQADGISLLFKTPALGDEPPGGCDATTATPNSGPTRFALHRNRPNPFTPFTTIPFDLPRPAPVDLRVYDLSGRLVKVLIDSARYPAGPNAVHWDGTDAAGHRLASATYFYRLTADGRTMTRRMTLLK